MATTNPAPPTTPIRIPGDILAEIDKRAGKAAKNAGVTQIPGLRAALIASVLRDALGLPAPTN